MWKEGQLKIVNGIEYKVTKIPDYDFFDENTCECQTCDLGLKTAKWLCLECLTKNLIPTGCNLKLVKSCIKQDK